ncbi:MAG: penicillin-binding protein 2 [Myxococcales bacterium]|nr:penicillin-binding protein 2 [Myxococcales bacterium]
MKRRRPAVAPRRRARPALMHARRLVLLGVFVLGCYGTLLARAAYLQAVDSEWLQEIAERQGRTTIHLGPLRGDLLDRNRDRLALSATVESVSASPRRIEATEDAARKLARILKRSAARFRRILAGGRSFVWVQRWVTPEEADRVRALGITGVNLHPERKRFYPSRDLAAAYLGFAGRDGVGLTGLELAFDNALRGHPTSIPARRDASGVRLIRFAASPGDRRGASIILSLDSRLQHVAERELDAAIARTGASHATLVAIDPRTGDILALAERPSFDPNLFWTQSPQAFRTRAFVHPFEPGSTLKPFVIAVGLEESAIRPGDRLDCEHGSWQVADHVIRDASPYGELSIEDVLRVSSNICAAKIAEKIGSKRLVAGLRKFGFGRTTGSGYPGEAAGVVRALGKHQVLERANLAFGQGMTATALQLATGGAMLANGGRRVWPRLALRMESPEAGHALDWPSGIGERVLSEATAGTIIEMMEAVVENGTGRRARIPHYRVAGKTGTAQKVVDGTYSKDRVVASFLGIVPARDPRLVIVVVLDEPDPGYGGGSAAAPVFRKVASFGMSHLGRAESAE